ncbi:hypothetical protein LEMLEM_LOCUS7733 [Lemmus lemmus]
MESCLKQACVSSSWTLPCPDRQFGTETRRKYRTDTSPDSCGISEILLPVTIPKQVKSL